MTNFLLSLLVAVGAIILFTGFGMGQAREREHRFQEYAVPVYRGGHAKPNFKTDPGSIQYRTRIREGMAGPVTFAGEYASVVFGCGTDCRWGFVADVRTGRIIDLPLGGEENYGLWLDARPKSRLLKTWWIDTKNDDKCSSTRCAFGRNICWSGIGSSCLTSQSTAQRTRTSAFPTGTKT